jgi:hypothetical protein
MKMKIEENGGELLTRARVVLRQRLYTGSMPGRTGRVLIQRGALRFTPMSLSLSPSRRGRRNGFVFSPGGRDSG